MLEELAGRRTDASAPIRLVIFGDSWCRDESMKTWPELLGQRLGWPTVNVALPGSDSNTLSLQCKLLEAILERSGRRLHPEAWALVHTGGNDVLRSGPKDILRAMLRTICCCCACLPICWGAYQMFDAVVDNVEKLAVRLREPPFGVRNMMVVGLPLCMQMPVIERYMEFLIGVSPALQFAGRHAVARMNTIFLDRLQSIDARIGEDGSLVALNEASALESIANDAVAEVTAAMAEKRSQAAVADAHEADTELKGMAPRAGATGSADDAAVETAVAQNLLWSDMMHPSQRTHFALANVRPSPSPPLAPSASASASPAHPAHGLCQVMFERFENFLEGRSDDGSFRSAATVMASVFSGLMPKAVVTGSAAAHGAAHSAANADTRGSSSPDDGSGSDGADTSATARLI